MFVSFTKTLKKMSGFRLGFGVRVNKRNAPLWCFAMLFAGMFYLMWYMIIGAGWCLYFFLWAFYKIYYYLFKGIAVGCIKGVHHELIHCHSSALPKTSSASMSHAAAICFIISTASARFFCSSAFSPFKYDTKISDLRLQSGRTP